MDLMQNDDYAADRGATSPTAFLLFYGVTENTVKLLFQAT